MDVSGFNTENVTTMAFMFSDCSGLTSLDVSSFNLKNVTTMAMMFQNCSGLKSLDVSRLDTKNVKDLEFMFYNCSALTELEMVRSLVPGVLKVSRHWCNVLRKTPQNTTKNTNFLSCGWGSTF